MISAHCEPSPLLLLLKADAFPQRNFRQPTWPLQWKNCRPQRRFRKTDPLKVISSYHSHSTYIWYPFLRNRRYYLLCWPSLIYFLDSLGRPTCTLNSISAHTCQEEIKKVLLSILYTVLSATKKYIPFTALDFFLFRNYTGPTNQGISKLRVISKLQIQIFLIKFHEFLEVWFLCKLGHL